LNWLGIENPSFTMDRLRYKLTKDELTQIFKQLKYSDIPKAQTYHFQFEVMRNVNKNIFDVSCAICAIYHVKFIRACQWSAAAL